MTTMNILQLIIAAGLLNVWLFRFNRSTAYRGGGARSMKEEFAAYGLPNMTTYAVGTLKVVAAFLLIAGIWYPVLVPGVSLMICILMVGAIAMHLKIKDSFMKSVPALIMLGLNLLLIAQATQVSP